MQSYYALIEAGMGWLGVLGSVAGLRHIVLPQPSSREVLDIFQPELTNAVCDISFFTDLPDRLIDYFNGKPVTFPDLLDWESATDFQRAVWQATRSIPYGETKSYSWVARQTGTPGGARAVGQALTRNHLPILVPCHRVIGNRKGLGGFSYGREMKRRLLIMEGAGIR